TEDADERRGEEIRQLDRDLEPLEMLFPRAVDRDLADRRGDADYRQTIVGQTGLDLLPQRRVEIEDIFAGDPAQLEVRDAVGLADGDLFVEVRRNLVGEGG